MGFVSDLAVVDAAVAGYFDEGRFLVVPTGEGPLGPNTQRMASIVRTPFEFAGTLEFGPPAMQGSAQSPRGMAGMPPGGSGVSHQAVITALSTGWPYHPAKDDQISHGGQAYTVATVQQDGTDRVAIYVNRARSS